MKITALNHPLGMGKGTGMEGVRIGVGVAGSMGDIAGGCVYPCFAPSPKLWIAAAIGAAGGLASSLLGGSAASSAAREAERRQREQEAKERAWYNRRYNEDYVDTAAGQSLVRRAKEYAKEQWKKAAGAQAVAGGTDAAAQMAKDAGNKMVGDTIANIAATDQARKAQVDNMHRQAEQNFAQMDMNREMQRAQNITNATQNASNAIMSAAGALEQTSGASSQANAKTPNLAGGSNNGVYQQVSGGGKVYSDGNGGILNLSQTDDDIRRAAAGVFGR